jgi:hypothetical protein
MGTRTSRFGSAHEKVDFDQHGLVNNIERTFLFYRSFHRELVRKKMTLQLFAKRPDATLIQS